MSECLVCGLLYKLNTPQCPICHGTTIPIATRVIDHSWKYWYLWGIVSGVALSIIYVAWYNA